MTWGQVKTFLWGTAVVVIDALFGWAFTLMWEDQRRKETRRGRN